MLNTFAACSIPFNQLVGPFRTASSVPLTVNEPNYADRVWSIQTIQALTDKEMARAYINKHWVFLYGEVEASDIPFIAELVKEEILSTRIRDAIYTSLENMIPKFGNEEANSSHN